VRGRKRAPYAMHATLPSFTSPATPPQRRGEERSQGGSRAPQCLGGVQRRVAQKSERWHAYMSAVPWRRRERVCGTLVADA